ncbi:hypothetical protein [Gardnerella sp. Marseille-Q2328]|uniref:hypothetical protein n=1 Tax=Gardnerella sp. Marseille-Q2328 TaxID=2759694 RepID=UPI0020259850|nr:hypothetical protein [Gardnerella sp. Marseille-Q2328]
MGYESVSALLVLIILVALWFGWLPKRTVNGMKTMLEHREDRFSPSLHLVGEWSTVRICDGTGMVTKGVRMQPTQQKRALTPEHIARIRAARRAAVRRRRVLVLSLAVLTLLVLLSGYSGLFSPIFAIIPLAMLAVVLFCGARASKHARQWEARVASMRVATKRQSEDARYDLHNGAVMRQLGEMNPQYSAEIMSSEASSVPVESVAFDETNIHNLAKAQNNVSLPHQGSRDDTETSIMEQREIRVAVRKAVEERDAVLRKRMLAQKAAVADVDDSAVEVVDTSSSAHEDKDLISFTLDAKSKGDSDNVANNVANDIAATSVPESLEIKSTKQVTKAVPVKNIAQSSSAKPAHFHAEEQNCEVEAPESSADSLGVADLRDVLARRNA